MECIQQFLNAMPKGADVVSMDVLSPALLHLLTVGSSRLLNINLDLWTKSRLIDMT